MHLSSFSLIKYPFVPCSGKALMTGLQELHWVRPIANESNTQFNNNCRQCMVAYDFSSPIDKSLDYSHSLFAKIYHKAVAKFCEAQPKYHMTGWLLGLCALALPIMHYWDASSVSTNNPSATNPMPMSGLTVIPNVLKIATVKDGSIYFVDTQAGHNYEHGFGYEVVRNYAAYLNVQLQLEVYPSTKEALQAVASGKADMALTTLDQTSITYPTIKQSKAGFTPINLKNEQIQPITNLQALSLSCNKDFLQKNGIDNQLSWSMAANNQALAQNASHFLCDSSQLGLNEKLADFYNQNVLKDAYSQQHFSEAMQDNLPKYKASFQQSAKDYDHDWQLLVAMSYQESHLEPDAVSPTGVQGMMMLTNDTAKEMGVTDRIDPVQSIEGGAKYLNQLKAQFSDVADNDKLWFALASYNMGPMAVKNIQTTLAKQGKNGNSWAQVYRYMAENTDKNRRYSQCMDYVTNIRGYLEQIKLASLQTGSANLLKSA